MKAKVILAVVAVALLAGWMAGTARADLPDFRLEGVEQMTVDTMYQYGWLYHQSKVWIVPGGGVNSFLRAYDESTVDMSGGEVGFFETYGSSTAQMSGGYTGIYTHDTSHVLITGGEVQTIFTYDSSTANISHESSGVEPIGIIFAHDTSTLTLSAGHLGSHIDAFDSSHVNITGGSVDDRVIAEHNSTMDISGGSLGGLDTWNDSVVDISGGTVGGIRAYGYSTIIFHGYGFQATGGLKLHEGDTVEGTGILSGKWMDGTAWATTIFIHEPGATILAIPEPASLSLLALGGLAMIRRRR